MADLSLYHSDIDYIATHWYKLYITLKLVSFYKGISKAKGHLAVATHTAYITHARQYSLSYILLCNSSNCVSIYLCLFLIKFDL